MDSEEVSAGGETSIASEVSIDNHPNELLSKMTEPREAYILNCKLNKKRDEELKDLHQEFAALEKELEETKFTLKSERSVKKLIKNKCFEALKELQFTKEELMEKEAQLKKCKRELMYAREEQESKDVEIAELTNIITSLQLHSANDEALPNISEEELDLSPRRSRTSLSPIPEENRDEIPDYDDVCQAYVSSLHILIGSDSQINETTVELPPRRHRKMSKSLENISRDVSIFSAKENSQQIDGHKRKKKTKFSSMFNLAHF